MAGMSVRDEPAAEGAVEDGCSEGSDESRGIVSDGGGRVRRRYRERSTHRPSWGMKSEFCTSFNVVRVDTSGSGK